MSVREMSMREAKYLDCAFCESPMLERDATNGLCRFCRHVSDGLRDQNDDTTKAVAAMLNELLGAIRGNTP